MTNSIPFDTNLLTPTLKPMTWAGKRGLSSPDFGHANAHIALSKDLCVGLRYGNVTMTHTAVALSGLSLREAWNYAADNLLNRAHTAQGIAIDIRPSSQATRRADTRGYQIRIGDDVPATAWLAHPATFRALNEHFEKLFSSPVHFHAPTENLLFVHQDTPHPTALDRWVYDHFIKHPSVQVLSPQPVVCDKGFAIPRLITRPVSARHTSTRRDVLGAAA
jgi:hypothetical protein